MLYIAIFSILCGLVLIFIAIISGPSAEKGIVSSGPMSGTKRDKKASSGSTFNTRETKSVHKYPSAKDYSKQVAGADQNFDSDRLELFSDEVNLNLDDFEEKRKSSETYSSVDASVIEFNAAFYEDNSQIIDYNRETGTIDPTFNEYKKIKRVGEGTLNIENDGLNFYMGRKFFRFDFSRVSDLKIGDNYIAVLMQGSSAVKLFLIKNNRESILQARSMYDDFLAMAS